MSIYKKAPFTKVTELTNSSVSKLVASKGAGKKLKQYADIAAAVAAGLKPGDLFVSDGSGLIAAGTLLVVV